jgi:ribosomal protein L11 methyltransferase
MEVSLTVSGELAEAVAEVLARYARNGVITEQGVSHLDAEDEGTADGPVTVRAYLPMDEGLAATRLKLEDSLRHLAMIQPVPQPTFRTIADQNWMDAWKAHYRPIPVGRRLLIIPAWLDSFDPTRVAVRIEPGMAFGTGTHPSTQLCLELIEAAVDRDTGDGPPVRTAFIDVGCGSGILSIAAIKLGVKEALAVDIDAEAIRNARQNAASNGIGPELALGAGSVGDIRDGKFGITAAPLVAANILAPVIMRMFSSGLADLVAPGGEIILGGILLDQGADVLAAAEATGLLPKQRCQMGDWMALAMAKS